jgi:tripartite-type tricarboxylate transporter receptor subunit TctC
VRSTELPDVPTLIEAGFAHVDLRPQWNGAFAVAGTPPAIKSKLEMELRRVLADVAVRERIRAISYDPGGGPGDEFARQIDAEIKIYSDIVKAANLKFD